MDPVGIRYHLESLGAAVAAAAVLAAGWAAAGDAEMVAISCLAGAAAGWKKMMLLLHLGLTGLPSCVLLLV